MKHLLWLWLALMLAVAPARAEDSQFGAARATIEAQMRAFLADDGATAYSYAAPSIRQIFPTPDIFMGMVAQGYPPIRRPQRFEFGKAEALSPGSVAQQVFVTGPDGKDYEAVYTLEMQPDGMFRITGVTLRVARAFSA